ncbi:ribosomal protection-like ABC-F family protein [Dehalobacter sp. 4CP]|uniref:ribosomal protection-like ABC-F family protein n=1 Tax=Dehalobacter sp. CP TaxID=2594474 RepID=UPI0039EB2DEA
MALINIDHLTFCYDGSYDNIFENVSFQIDTDWKLGFTGRNGRGKTTFLQLLCGKYEYRGTIESPVSFDYFPFQVTDPSQNVIEVVASICPAFEHWELQKELSLLEVAEDVLELPFAALSQGEQTKVLLAALFIKPHNFLLIDEPTNHLDIEGRRVVGKYLNRKTGFILVSHDRFFLDRCIDHILTINKTNIELQKGNFSTWWVNKERTDSFETAENDRLQKEIKQLSAAARRTAGWSDKIEKTKKGTLNSGIKPDKGYIGHQAAKMMKRSKVIEARQQKNIQTKEKLLKNIELADSLSMRPLSHPKNTLVELRDLAIYYADRKVCENVHFTVERGERVALSGRNGSGKSSVLKLLIGEDLASSGKVNIGSNLRISYISQDTAYLQGSLRSFAEQYQIEESRFLTILHKLDFSGVQFEKDMRMFSAGQKKKVLLAKSLCEQAHLYIWDEPLNYIDVLSRMQIEDLIVRCRPTLLFVEHDSAFVQSVATKYIRL